MKRKGVGRRAAWGVLLAYAVVSRISAALAAIVSVTARQEAPNAAVVVTYELDGEAIVTADVLRDGVSLGANAQAVCVGDVMRRVAAGTHSFTWNPQKGEIPVGETTSLAFALTAWDVETPPDVIVCDLRDGELRYYPSLAALPDGVTDDRYKTTEIVFRRIPGTAAGDWTMGSPTDEAGHKTQTFGNWALETQHTVRFTNDWYMGVYPVTQAQYLRVRGNYPDSFFTNALARAKRPVDSLSLVDVRGSAWPENLFDGANASKAVGKFRAATGLFLDLPTEAQWEFACRASTTTPYASGTTVTTAGRYKDNGGEPSEAYPENLEGFVSGGSVSDYRNWTAGNGAPEVGTFEPNALGLYDMHGGVFEYCLDWAGTADWDTTIVYTNPVGVVQSSSFGGITVVARGGAWSSEVTECRSAARRIQNYQNAGGKDTAAPPFGFRLAIQNVPPDVRKETKTAAAIAVAATSVVGVTEVVASAGLDARTVWQVVSDYVDILTAKLGALLIIR